MGTITTLTPPTKRFFFGKDKAIIVSVFGNADWWQSEERRTEVALSQFSPRRPTVCFTAIPPSKETKHKGRFVIEQPRGSGIESVEGAVLIKPGMAGITWVRDCFFLVIRDDATGVAGFAHVGRDSLLQQPDCDGCTAGVVSNLLNAVAPDINARDHVSVLYGGGICSRHFTHKTFGEMLAALHARFPDAVKDEPPHSCDVGAIIWSQLKARKVNPLHIQQWDTCSYGNESLGSKRATDGKIPGKGLPNVVVVARQK